MGKIYRKIGSNPALEIPRLDRLFSDLTNRSNAIEVAQQQFTATTKNSSDRIAIIDQSTINKGTPKSTSFSGGNTPVVISVPFKAGMRLTTMSFTVKDRRANVGDYRTLKTSINFSILSQSVGAGWHLVSGEDALGFSILEDLTLADKVYRVYINVASTPDRLSIRFDDRHYGFTNTYGAVRSITVNYEEV